MSKKIDKKTMHTRFWGSGKFMKLTWKNWLYSSSEGIGEIGMRSKKSLWVEKIVEISGEMSKFEFSGDKGRRFRKSLCWERIFSKSSTETQKVIYIVKSNDKKV